MDNEQPNRSCGAGGAFGRMLDRCRGGGFSQAFSVRNGDPACIWVRRRPGGIVMVNAWHHNEVSPAEADGGPTCVYHFDDSREDWNNVQPLARTNERVAIWDTVRPTAIPTS